MNQAVKERRFKYIRQSISAPIKDWMLLLGALPEDTLLCGCDSDTLRGCYTYLLASTHWEPVQEGTLIPELMPVWTRDELGHISVKIHKP